MPIATDMSPDITPSLLDVDSRSLPAFDGPVGRFRWRICGMLFFATTVNYMDRQILALLKPILQSPTQGIGMTEIQYAGIVAVFSAAYALGLLLAGKFIDRLGTRIGYAAVFCLWSLGAASHTLVKVPAFTNALHHLAWGTGKLLSSFHMVSAGRTLQGLSGAILCFALARFVLGLGESGNFPAAIKAVSEWFPQRERAFATGIFNSGCNIGATLAPFAVAFVVIHFGWPYAFLTTTGLSLTWLVLWLLTYKSPEVEPKLSSAEFAYILSDANGVPESQGSVRKVSWGRLFRYRQTWAFLLAKVLTDPIWWFYLYWLPGFLNAKYGLSITKMGLPLLVIYNVSTVGSVFGGWLPAWLMGKGWSLNRARKTAMFIYALAVVPVIFAGRAHSVWPAVAIISLATAAHQAWSANLFTTVSDMFPKEVVASVVGIGASGGSFAMMFFGLFVGYVLQIMHGNYLPVFVIAGTSYLLAIGVIHALAPKLNRVRFG